MSTDLNACTRCHGTGREPGLIPVKGLEPAVIRSVRRDEAVVWQFRCPRCLLWGDIDDDQLRGRVSIDHWENSGCGFHETHDLLAMAGLA